MQSKTAWPRANPESKGPCRYGALCSYWCKNSCKFSHQTTTLEDCKGALLAQSKQLKQHQQTIQALQGIIAKYGPVYRRGRGQSNHQSKRRAVHESRKKALRRIGQKVVTSEKKNESIAFPPISN